MKSVRLQDRFATRRGFTNEWERQYTAQLAENQYLRKEVARQKTHLEDVYRFIGETSSMSDAELKANLSYLRVAIKAMLGQGYE